MVWLWLLCRPSASQRLWKVWREQRERRKGKGRAKERARGGKVLLNNKAWLPSREPSLASGVSLHSCLSLILYVCLSALHCLFRQPFPFRTSHLQHAVYGFLLWIDPPPSFLPLNQALSTLPVHPNLWGAGAYRTDKTSEFRPLIYSGGVALRLRRFMAVSHVVAFKEPGFKNVGHLK